MKNPLALLLLVPFVLTTPLFADEEETETSGSDNNEEARELAEYSDEDKAERDAEAEERLDEVLGELSKVKAESATAAKPAKATKKKKGKLLKKARRVRN